MLAWRSVAEVEEGGGISVSDRRQRALLEGVVRGGWQRLGSAGGGASRVR